jgi:hypothetical protein
MSELNELIATSSSHAYHAGELHERDRIVKLLKQRYAENVDHCEWGTHLFLDNAIALIKGEQK